MSDISKINNTFIANAEDLDIVMPIQWHNTMTIILEHQDVYGIIIMEMKWMLLLMKIILQAIIV